MGQSGGGGGGGGGYGQLIGQYVGSGVSNYFATAAHDALNQKLKLAQARITGTRDKYLTFVEQAYKDQQPLQAAGLDEVAKARALYDQQATDPTLSAGYRLASREGLKNLQADFATGGSPTSGAAALAAGRFSAGLSANERDRQYQTLQQLSQIINSGADVSQIPSRFRLAAYGPEINLLEDITGLDVARGNNDVSLYNAYIQDVAKNSGSSGATVDRYLNNRSGGGGGGEYTSGAVGGPSEGSSLGGATGPNAISGGGGSDVAGSFGGGGGAEVGGATSVGGGAYTAYNANLGGYKTVQQLALEREQARIKKQQALANSGANAAQSGYSTGGYAGSTYAARP